MANVQQSNNKISDFMKIKEAAEFIGVPISTLRQWDRKGKLKPVRHPMNGYRLYQRDELEQILDEINGIR
jgi:DNA-binding transcriptional MerR regulator